MVRVSIRNMNAKPHYSHWGIICLLFLALQANATVYYVNGGNTAPVAPFTSWATAATNIQDAINVTANGDTVLVTNGVYAFSGEIIAGSLLNRVALTNAITVQSVNGPWVTTILGGGATNGAAAVRCAWLTNGASLVGFTLTGGATSTSGDTPTLQSGGGVWCASSNSLIGNCVIISNTAGQYGDAVYQGTINNSLISSNGAGNLTGGAAYRCVLENCTIAGNTSYGVASPMAMTNCIIYYNYPTMGINYTVSGSAFVHCCTTPALAGTGNITASPQLFADGVHLGTNSPCIGTGVNTAIGTDIFGATWSNPPSIGCAEWNPALVLIPQPVVQFPPGGGLAVSVNVDGQPPYFCSWIKDGQPVQNNGHYTSATSTTLMINNLGPSDAGAYQVVVSNSFGMVTSAVLQVSGHCVSPNGAALPPYSDWTTAATNVQDAINVAQPGDFVLVTNGLYAFGGLAMAGNLTNRVALTNAISVQSVNGPWVTTILGGGATNRATAVRCAWLTNGAALFGFTLDGGATQVSGNLTTAESGGGAWCASSNALIGNCVIVSNTAEQNGGGVFQGTVLNSLISSNGTAFGSGGAAYSAVLNNCTVVSNATIGVVSPIAMTNCILYYNSVTLGNYSASGSAYVHCCTTPALAGTGNFTSAPQLFADGVHLTTNSPCIGAGINTAVGTDIFGQGWSNPPSIGCAEWQPLPVAATPQIQLTGDPVGFSVGAAFSGLSPFVFSWIKDGTLLQDNGHFSGTQTPSLAVAGANSGDAGGYQLVVSNSFGMVTSAVVQLVIHCVNINGASPTPPYLTWSTAATNIQDAITASAVGDIVLVTNGLYATGGVSMDGVITNRVSINKAILVESVNGPNTTAIQGAWDPNSTNGPGAIRCVWMTTNSILGGFTVYGGATRAYATGGQAVYGGGVWGPKTNLNSAASPACTVANCIIMSNAASYLGGGAYEANLNYCTIATNAAIGNGTQGGAGGGAAACNLKNCFVTANTASGSSFSEGGGMNNCNSRNCAVNKNSSTVSGGGAYQGTLTNCSVNGNFIANINGGTGGGVANCTLVNCIVYANQDNSLSYSSNSNSTGCTFSFSCTTPAASGTGNITSDPLLLGDGIHLSSASPCIGAGSSAAVSGADIDGQSWNSPPSMGCDEWQPPPIIAVQPNYAIGPSTDGLTGSVVVAGQAPFSFFWTQNGSPIQDNGHYSNSSTANLTINNFGPADAGTYQVVVTNSYGSATSAVVQVVIHAVNVAGPNPTSPYSTWATAATNIQDAINAALPGDFVLVTNGLYTTGGTVITGNLTNRVAITKPVTVTSVNGYAATIIQGAWDPVSTTGPDAVRCVYLSSGSVLNGFTLQNGATLASDGSPDASDSGGGIYCATTNGVASDCFLSNNFAIFGGGIANGTLDNSVVVNNQANQGGGAYDATLNNCTVEINYAVFNGGGTYGANVRNSIVVENYLKPALSVNNYFTTFTPQFFYSCTSPAPSGTGNINVNPQFLDAFHLSSTSPCIGAGNAAYASGSDLDGEPWNNSPSMGCDEVILSNLVGALSVNIVAPTTNILVNRGAGFLGHYTGRASSDAWIFSDGVSLTNSPSALRLWNTVGTYSVTFTVYNNDNPAGVSTNVVFQVVPVLAAQLQPAGIVSNAFQFQFSGQTNANYTIQYTTNLTSPVVWQTLQSIFMNQNSVIQVNDPAWTNGARFYHVLAQ